MSAAALQAIIDLADARLRDDPLNGTDHNVRHDLTEILRIATEAMPKKPRYCKHCPFAEHVHHPDVNAQNGCPGFEWDEEKI